MEEKESRQLIENFVRRRILGPGYAQDVLECSPDASDEVLDRDPILVYTTGVMYPEIKVDDAENIEVDESSADDMLDDDNTDDTNSDNDDDLKIDTSNDDKSKDDKPRCAGADHIGLVTCVDMVCDSIRLDVDYATYVKLSSSEYKNVKLKIEYGFDNIDKLIEAYDKLEIDDGKPISQHLNVDKEKCCVSVDSYISVNVHDLNIPSDLRELNRKFHILFTPLYKRVAHHKEFNLNTKDVDVKGSTITVDNNCNILTKIFIKGGKKYVKVLLRSAKTIDRTHKSKYSDCLFQAKVRLTPVNGSLVKYNEPVKSFDEEYEQNEYIYRNVENYGKGVCCAVMWDKSGKWIETEYIPYVDVKKYSNSLDERYCNELGIDYKKMDEVCRLINLSHWSSYDDNQYISNLRDFVNGYGVWRNRQQIEASQEPRYQDVYKPLLKRQGELFQRLVDNIDYLEKNQEALACFKLANTAMLIQMLIARNPKFDKDRKIDSIVDGKDVFDKLDWFKDHESQKSKRYVSYRPFQLAFLLMNVKSTFEQDDPNHKDDVDLIWFPTGGGKTEAYLALTALTIIARRRRNVNDEDKGAGVSVIMRYTLRLLTSQQFERASYLITALEFMRSKDSSFLLGSTPITIGMWIGIGTTPNTAQQWNSGKYRSFRDDVTQGKNPQRNPYPISYCPWCGGKLVNETNHGYIAYNDTQCLNRNCHFHDSLPILYVDEALYQTPPTLLFATVDKFAQLDTKQAAALLGIGTKADSPDLIIQDELHLISGPLGSMVGFFEYIVEQMASKDGRRPKIIASTATTRNTQLLVKRLYNRNVRIFPAQGITYDDNYFSHVEKDSLRRHIGISPQAFPVKAENRLISLLILSRVALTKRFLQENRVDLNDSQKVYDAIISGDSLIEDLDNYWPIVLYYNSLKDLGRTRSRISQEIYENLRLQASYLQIPPTISFAWEHIDKRIKEFTSREESSRIKSLLTKAEAKAKVELTAKGNIIEDGNNIDLVLASNMISVGIDISRWDIMLMSGQPRSVSEYIQSSSRVGRTHKGLVVNLYSPVRTRETSLYENFTSFNSAYYKYVEPLSITPLTDQILRNDIASNILHCFQKYVKPELAKDKDKTIDALVDELKNRFDIDDELADRAHEEFNSRWGDSISAKSLRDVDPPVFAMIQQVLY